MAKYIDIADEQEDERIRIIGTTVMQKKKTVAILVDDIPGKPERYIRKLKARFPGIVIQEQLKGPIANVVTIKLGPPDVKRN